LDLLLPSVALGVARRKQIIQTTWMTYNGQPDNPSASAAENWTRSILRTLSIMEYKKYRISLLAMQNRKPI